MANEMMRRNDWLDPFFDDFGRHFFGNMQPTDQVLKTDIKETEKNYVANVDVPGIAKDDIKLNYQDGILNISVKKTDFNDHEDKDGNVLMSERHYGAMSRSYRLPNVKEQDIKAHYEDGVLTITLPKLTADEKSPHQIGIE
ncbi:Hsp20/alpha crystallin family protein [Lacticaseibacillus yichunensis]|uniref:Hsp20/alpha crystallin family protein n=1 Tax=Lacticaseibacillus yichunensis TaxID=2486015 RepID=A0ABW4CP41_9LACO|nr:Hsp20/alpha crystallin family protein [Lacticaseibacillus yichunensis]